MKMHKSVTTQRVVRLARKSMFSAEMPRGICLACGKSQVTDSDAEKDTCKHCGKPQVYGAELLLVML